MDVSEFTLAEALERGKTYMGKAVKKSYELEFSELTNTIHEHVVLEMEKLYRKQGNKVKQHEFCEELATKFSCSANRNGKSTVTWDQSESLVADSDAATKQLPLVNSSPTALKNLVALSKAWATAERPNKPKALRVSELTDLIYEALSSKDCAWYDVAAFLNFRILYSGELEVRVRFSGFNHDQDEWVNVRNGLRERSIPLDPLECHKVKVGDLVLCFRANEDHALYSDAHVVRVERQLHDKDCCTCTFVVRFEYDDTEGEVQYTEICCRPS